MINIRVVSRAGIALALGIAVAFGANAGFGLQLEPFALAFGLLVGFLAGGED